MILPPEFYERDTQSLARALLGMCLVHDSRRGRTSGRIVETEAYLCDDAACHAARGKTKRNAVMFGPPGHTYVYLIYGSYYCFNVVSAREGIGEAVLIRALEPLEGIPLMRRRRGTDDLHNLCSGPGKLCVALDITPKQNGATLYKVKGALTITDLPHVPAPSPDEIVTTPRIGINAENLAVHEPLRYYIRGSAFASRRCIHAPRRRPARSDS
jgi:DNA-3-methyladenine glycosylase